MTGLILRKWVLVIGAGLLSGYIAACFEDDSQVCTLRGCAHAPVSKELMLASPDEAHLSCEVCVNGACSNGMLDVEAGAGGAVAKLAGTVEVDCRLERRAAGTSARWFLNVQFLQPERLNSGDTVEVRIRDTADNTTLVDVSQKITVSDSFPNGESCEPTCRTHNLSLDV